MTRGLLGCVVVVKILDNYGAEEMMAADGIVLAVVLRLGPSGRLDLFVQGELSCFSSRNLARCDV